MAVTSALVLTAMVPATAAPTTDPAVSQREITNAALARQAGGEGAVLLENGHEIARATPPRVDAVDGTAAGDAFTACLVVSLLEGRDREEALHRACIAGALAASRP